MLSHCVHNVELYLQNIKNNGIWHSKDWTRSIKNEKHIP